MTGIDPSDEPMDVDEDKLDEKIDDVHLSIDIRRRFRRVDDRTQYKNAESAKGKGQSH